MAKKYLITGGAGFIGSFIADALLEKGDEVRILDSLEEQVHGGQVPRHANMQAEFRHCYADNTKIRQRLGWVPEINLEEGMAELAEWSTGQQAEDRSDVATEELRQKGLV
ncbi:MAG: GDP-mannose 4,6-dehydratase [Candidatus Aenigmarchaeota archaeon]|nr:GDP-mannose 4,6-dehydratase [Candidatus Aenigmarchaeota archaeon]